MDRKSINAALIQSMIFLKLHFADINNFECHYSLLMKYTDFQEYKSKYLLL